MENVGQARHEHTGAPLSPEEQARADWYALFATLFQTPPSAALLRQIASVSADPATGLGRAFAQFAERCARADEDQVRQEFDIIFIGVGRPEVFLQASYYLTGFLHERPLAALRERLAELGLTRGENLSLTEDHFGVLCETMRFLILGVNNAPIGIEVQREIFNMYIAPCVEALCDEIEACESGDFYRSVAGLSREFFAVERQAFDFLS